MPEIISFIGRNGAGKSTCAEKLALELNNLGFSVQRLSFATPLKTIVKKYFQTTKEEGGRMKLEEFGQDMKKFIGEDVWAKALVNRINPEMDYVIIDDLRYFIEQCAIGTDYKLHTIYVTRESQLDESLEIQKIDIDRLNLLLYNLNWADFKIHYQMRTDIEDEIGNILDMLGVVDDKSFFPPEQIAACMGIDISAIKEALGGNLSVVDAVIVIDGQFVPMNFRTQRSDA